jgi:hypothetical protein
MAGTGTAERRDRDSTWISELRFEIHDEAIKFNDKDGARLIKKVTARRPDGTVFWTQGFYRSSGKSSRFKNVWFPFLGISLRLSGATYFTKGLRFPESWPAEDRFNKKEFISDRTSELISRFGTRSFLLAANALNALSDDPEQLDDMVSQIFEGVVPEDVDPVIQKILVENTGYDDAKWAALVSGLHDATPEEVNKFIGSDIYINYGKPGAELVNLGAGPLPEYFLMDGGMWRRRRKSRRRRGSNRRNITRHKQHKPQFGKN